MHTGQRSGIEAAPKDRLSPGQSGRYKFVYESHWGNTAAVARAVAEGLGPDTPVLSTGEAAAAAVEGVDLLLVGAPVLAFRLSTSEMLESMRVKPGKGTPPDLSHPPVRVWLESLPAGAGAAAAFDTSAQRRIGARPAVGQRAGRGGSSEAPAPATTSAPA